MSAVEAVTRELGGSTADGVRRGDDERATVMPFDGGPAEQALRSQQQEVLPPDAGPYWTVLASVDLDSIFRMRNVSSVR